MNYVNARELFNKSTDSYDAVRRLKRYENAGIKFIYVKNQTRIAVRYMMYIIVAKSNEGYSLQEIYDELLHQD